MKNPRNDDESMMMNVSAMSVSVMMNQCLLYAYQCVACEPPAWQRANMRPANPCPASESQATAFRSRVCASIEQPVVPAETTHRLNGSARRAPDSERSSTRPQHCTAGYKVWYPCRIRAINIEQPSWLRRTAADHRSIASWRRHLTGFRTCSEPA